MAACDVSLARVDLARVEAAAAEPLLRRALLIDQRAFRAGDWRIAAIESLLGEALTALGRYDEAERVLVAAREDLKDAPGREGLFARQNRVRLAALYKAWGHPER